MEVKVNERQMEIVADDLEHLYVTWKQQVIKHYKATPSDRKALEKVATWCIEENLDPHMFFEAQVEDCGSVERFRAPFLHSCRAIEKYNYYKEKHVTEVSIGGLYEHYNNYILRLVQLGRDVTKTLLSDHHDIPAWYRIVVTVEPVQEIIDKFASQARKEIQLNPKILEFIKQDRHIANAVERIYNGRRI
jgi:hypothetical protein